MRQMPTAPCPLTVVNDARVFCPKCGYELTPIPQGQCSECGFGYDHKAIRAVATDFALNRISSYETAIALGVAAAACFVVMALPPIATIYLGRAIALAGLILASAQSYYIRWNIWTFSIAVAMPIFGILILRSGILIHAGIILLALSAVAGFYHRSEWQYLKLTASERMNRLISTHRRVFHYSLAIALIAGLWRLVRSIW